MEDSRFDDPKFLKWAFAVKKRDGFVCKVCGLKSVELNSHHLNSWDAYPEQRYDVVNGITLCLGHHNRFHDEYGWGQNTEEQFREFADTCKSIYKIAAIHFILEELEDGIAEAAPKALASAHSCYEKSCPICKQIWR